MIRIGIAVAAGYFGGKVIEGQAENLVAKFAGENYTTEIQSAVDLGAKVAVGLAAYWLAGKVL